MDPTATTAAPEPPAGRPGARARVVLLFFVLLAAHLAVAWRVYAPRGYYGTREAPSFSDPWLKRAGTILNGGLLYRDVSCTTPPLINYLLVCPTLGARAAGFQDPWTTLSFMLFFSAFALFTALLLLSMPAGGRRAAFLFLLNPLTLGNAVLRRQDEAVLVFFVAAALHLILQKRVFTGSLAVATAALVKLGGLLLVPVALLHGRNWKYLAIPLLVVVLVFAPFWGLAGRRAAVWDVGKRHTEHPFQFGGVGLVHMFNAMHEAVVIDVRVAARILMIAAAAAAGLVAWKRFGVLEDTGILLAACLLPSPKLHTGYLSLPALTLAPLVRTRGQAAAYLLFGGLAMAADFCKYPARNYAAAFWLMMATAAVLIGLTAAVTLRRPR